MMMKPDHPGSNTINFPVDGDGLTSSDQKKEIHSNQQQQREQREQQEQQQTQEREPHRPLGRILPHGFEPSPHTVIIGRGKIPKENLGNRRLVFLASSVLQKYQDGDKKCKSDIVSEIIDNIRKACSVSLSNRGYAILDRGAFVRQGKDGRWYEVESAIAREKVGYVFRDLLADQYKSSSKSKVARRQYDTYIRGSEEKEEEEQKQEQKQQKRKRHQNMPGNSHKKELGKDQKLLSSTSSSSSNSTAAMKQGKAKATKTEERIQSFSLFKYDDHHNDSNNNQEGICGPRKTDSYYGGDILDNDNSTSTSAHQQEKKGAKLLHSVQAPTRSRFPFSSGRIEDSIYVPTNSPPSAASLSSTHILPPLWSTGGAGIATTAATSSSSSSHLSISSATGGFGTVSGADSTAAGISISGATSAAANATTRNDSFTPNTIGGIIGGDRDGGQNKKRKGVERSRRRQDTAASRSTTSSPCRATNEPETRRTGKNKRVLLQDDDRNTKKREGGITEVETKHNIKNELRSRRGKSNNNDSSTPDTNDKNGEVFAGYPPSTSSGSTSTSGRQQLEIMPRLLPPRHPTAAAARMGYPPAPQHYEDLQQRKHYFHNKVNQEPAGGDEGGPQGRGDYYEDDSNSKFHRDTDDVDGVVQHEDTLSYLLQQEEEEELQYHQQQQQLLVLQEPPVLPPPATATPPSVDYSLLSVRNYNDFGTTTSIANNTTNSEQGRYQGGTGTGDRSMVETEQLEDNFQQMVDGRRRAEGVPQTAAARRQQEIVLLPGETSATPPSSIMMMATSSEAPRPPVPIAVAAASHTQTFGSTSSDDTIPTIPIEDQLQQFHNNENGGDEDEYKMNDEVDFDYEPLLRFSSSSRSNEDSTTG